MSIFNININYPSINYTNSISYKLYERCVTQLNTTENIQLLNSSNTIYSFLDSYSGENKSKLVITSINSNNANLNLKHNNVIINNIDLPLEIDISTVSNNTNIPNLILDIQTDLINNYTLGVYFYIVDENNQRGDTLYSTFQVQTIDCNELPVITSTLPIESNSTGSVNYQIVATNNPTNYFIRKLPTGITYDITTGLILGTSTKIGKFDITISITNSAGTSTTNTTIEIFNNTILPPVITSSLAITTSKGSYFSYFSYQIVATNSPTDYGFLLPVELKDLIINPLNPSIISGILSGVTSGEYTIGLTATNESGFDYKILTLTVI
jgi:hypothetical protein